MVVARDRVIITCYLLILWEQIWWIYAWGGGWSLQEQCAAQHKCMPMVMVRTDHAWRTPNKHYIKPPCLHTSKRKTFFRSPIETLPPRKKFVSFPPNANGQTLSSLHLPPLTNRLHYSPKSPIFRFLGPPSLNPQIPNPCPLEMVKLSA